MTFRILICVIVMYLIVFCDGNFHGFGRHKEFYGDVWFGSKENHLAYVRSLIDDNNKAETNYTIVYKYLGANLERIAYLEFDINVKSEGTVNATDTNTIEAKIHIYNALSVTALLRIYIINPLYEPPPHELSELIDMFYRKSRSAHDYGGKSIAFIYKKRSNPSKEKPAAQTTIGRRRSGDSLLHFESYNVTNNNRFPSRAFEYSGNDYITKVGFSFNSPTAMALINTSFVGEQEFNAVAYDMSTEHFVANMSVYGIKAPGTRPNQFEGVMGVI